MKKTTFRPDLFLNILPRPTKKAFEYCSNLPLFRSLEWYLAGGTALALQVGHRQSVDLDFFTHRARFPELSVERELLATGEWQTSFREKGTIYGKLLGAKISFISYPFFSPSDRPVSYGTINILTPRDIAAMKIIAVSQRGRKRDFIDLYWYCTNREPLQDVIKAAISKYPGQGNNLPHFIKSLIYFADADDDPMPKIFFNANWKQIKSFFEREVVGLSKNLFRI